MNPVSIHAYCWLPAWSTAGGERIVPRAAEFGFDHMVVPMRDHAVIEPDRIARLFECNGMTPVTSANQLPDADVSSLDPVVRQRGMDRHHMSLRLARDMGAKHMGGVLNGLLGKAAGPAPAGSLDAAAECLAFVANEAKAMGVRLAIEIVNRYESNLINSVADALAFLARVGSDNLKLHLDTFHMNIEEADFQAALEAALPHLAYFELDQNHRGLPDEGSLDFPAMLTRLRAANYKGVIGFEAFSSSIAGPDVAAGVAIWRDLFQNGDDVARRGMRLLGGGYTPQVARPHGQTGGMS
ncbi:sugar phosphate isomerase/epimerase [Phyllobacterium brassicacearum]|uniref:Sugar phosphate isomerase/epimerase n=2 Tax=Phyllobacterium brassicacearum TaxID=314235 RepID=A0A2P7BH35_9HYPH|nr:sugar phosphate isomerase/epimerase family protein [Phyllobacterium brassicacearum]PSH65780.1 sugar phosphate isomerase/epimerase [Phyllobacterium brassicacearum]